ncbi:hypothetical protein PLESTB_001656500 [Pleodorina starrii]|uniref:Amine oxidase domain-containing protein n=1 Tax=Pleodorina starrii TaxID=330485 RepID=A0A9W6F8V6_9CHLO|nr:hypothetical protein PLESTM_002007000 [Pleodorina starrii]GLC60674.1 hypothetical protein PLESTB_001656500 [Pleodorina starrii]
MAPHPLDSGPSGAEAQQAPGPEPIDTDVIVIGAGISGLACATALRGAGLRVTVLEARHRAGGRLHTVPLSAGPGRPSYPVDLGAAWVHGIGSAGAPNALYALACNLELGCRPTDYNDAAVYACDGSRLSYSAVADMEHLYLSFEQHLRSLLQGTDPRVALMPIQTALEAFAAQRRLSAAQTAHLSYAVSNHMEHYWAGEAGAMGVAALDEVVLPGGDVVLGEGYGRMVGALAAGLDDVRLGHEVQAVQYGSGGVAVTARVVPGAAAGGGGGGGGGSGSGGLVRLTARAAVVTLPLGVLRSGAVEFSPPLAAVDPAKAAAIARLGTAVYNKLIMLYDTSDVFWDDTAFIYRIPAPWECGRWSYFLNLHKVCGAPILVAFNLGEAAVQLETASDEEAVQGAMRALAGLYGTERVRRPRQAVVTRWGSDPYSRMSYTYVPAGLTGAAFDDVARPLLGRLYFAGEASHRSHYGTAHGAYDSGRMAAAAILQQLAAGGAAAAAAPPPRLPAWPMGRIAAAPPRVVRSQVRNAQWWATQLAEPRRGGGGAAAAAAASAAALCLAPTGGIQIQIQIQLSAVATAAADAVGAGGDGFGAGQPADRDGVGIGDGQPVDGCGTRTGGAAGDEGRADACGGNGDSGAAAAAAPNAAAAAGAGRVSRSKL